MGDIIANPEAFLTEVLGAIGLEFLAAFLIAYTTLVAASAGVSWLIQVIVNWKLFRKASERGWKSIIPIVNVYVTYRIAHARDLFWKMFRLCIYAFILGILWAVFYSLTDSMPENAQIWQIANLVVLVLMALVLISYAVVQIKFAVRFSRAFGYGNGFAVGLLFFPFIFRIILAFGKSTHCSKLEH